MDFVMGLPRTHRRHNSIWVIVDRITKSAHFLSVHTTYSAEDYAKLYIIELVRLHGVPLSIISDRDGQTERTIQILEDILRESFIDFKGSWDDHLPLIEFAYNNGYHSSIQMAPLEALYGRRYISLVGWFESSLVQSSDQFSVDLVGSRIQHQVNPGMGAFLPTEGLTLSSSPCIIELRSQCRNVVGLQPPPFMLVALDPITSIDIKIRDHNISMSLVSLRDERGEMKRSNSTQVKERVFLPPRGRDKICVQFTLSKPASKISQATTTLGLKKGDLLLADINTQLKNENITTDIKADTNSNIMATVTVDEVYPGLKTIISYDPTSPKIEVQNLNDYAGISTSLGLMTPNPSVNFSGVVGSDLLSLGADLSFDTKSRAITKCNAGLSFNDTNLNASLNLNDKGDCVSASLYYVYDDNPKTRRTVVGAEVSHSFSRNENIFTVGVDDQWVAPDFPLVTLKAKVNSLGKANAMIDLHKHITVSGEVDTRAVVMSAKFGLTLHCKPKHIGF
ncbi:Outer plastidial membrane protein porin [Capsicum annuum]|nr:Outer plastidial membrane protein porin [Capsicum annuum]